MNYPPVLEIRVHDCVCLNRPVTVKLPKSTFSYIESVFEYVFEPVKKLLARPPTNGIELKPALSTLGVFGFVFSSLIIKYMKL